MQDTTVEKLFNEQLEYYSKKDHSSGASALTGLFRDWIEKNKIKNKLDIIEFGGSAGQLLNTIYHQYPNAHLTNVEITKGYEKKQVLKKIKFINDSILCSGLPNQSYDVIIIRDIIHHLIGKNLTQTRKNQIFAIKEIKRLLRPNGLVLIEELVDQSILVCNFLYYLSKLNSKIGIRSDKLEFSPNTIVCFLNSKEISKILKKYFPKKNISIIFKKSFGNWKGKLVHLGSTYGTFIARIES